MRIPGIGRKTKPILKQDDIPKLMPEGIYEGKIARFGDARLSRIREGFYYIDIVVDINGRLCHMYYGGLLDTIYLLYANQELFIGMDVKVRCKIKNWATQDVQANEFRFIWPRKLPVKVD